MTTDRRRFLKLLAGSGTVVTMPAYLGGCGVLPAMEPAQALPGDPFLEWFGVDEAGTSRLLAELTANGADFAELFFQHRQQHALRLENGELTTPRLDIDNGVGLRVVNGDDSGFAHTEALDPESMRAAARAASAGAGGDEVVAPSRFARPAKASRYPLELAWSDVGAAERAALLERVESLARAADPRIREVTLTLTDADERVMIATFDGRLLTDRRPMTRLTAQLVATQNGITVSGFAATAARDGLGWYGEERLRELVATAVDRTLLQFDARQPPWGELPVVFAAGSSGVVLHEAVGHTLEADFARSGQSAWADRVGETVAAAPVTIVDDAGVPHARGALNVDDEGTPCGRNLLVEEGVLRGYLHDRRSARHYGVEPTGSARRESFRHEPMPRMTCTWLADGTATRDEIVAGVRRGILAETFVGGQVSLADGDFGFRVKNGWLIENGRLAMPVRDLHISGNGPDMLARVEQVGNDGRLDSGGWVCGKRGQRVPVSQGMPTTLVSSLTVSPDSA